MRAHSALKLIFLGCFLASAGRALGQAAAPTVAIARFNSRGIVGYVQFTTINETITLVSTNLTGLQDGTMGLGWHVHRFPVDLTLSPASRCLSYNVGGHYDPFNASFDDSYASLCAMDPMNCEVGDLSGKFGPLRNGAFEYTDNTSRLDLGGRWGIVGRSVVIHGPDGMNFACATIRSLGEINGLEVVTLSATFISPIAGTIFFRQVSGEEATMFGKFFWVDLTGPTEAHNWHIHEDSPSPSYRTGECVVGPHFDPFNRPPTNSSVYFCTPDPENITNCEVGDLTGKHSQISVAGNPLPYQTAAFFFTDIFLNLTGENAVEGRSVAIHAANGGGPIVACAPLVRTEVRTAVQFSRMYVDARQASPYDETTITTTSSLPSRRLTILTDVLNTYDLCPADGQSYNPFPLESGNTPDALAVGNLYQKYSTELINGNVIRVTELPVYGVNTITSRTLRISTDDRRICSALTPSYTEGTTLVAIASFNGPVVEGNIIFIQDVPSDVSLGFTNILVDIHYVDPNMEPTTGHSWHVHRDPPVSGQTCVSAIGPHFNPFDASLNNSNPVSNYTTDCSVYSPLRCESGDLSGKHGQLSIDPPRVNLATFSYLDPSLYLSGPAEHAIVGRSVGLHENTGNLSLFACAEIRQSYLEEVSVTITQPQNYNRVTFVQMITRAAGISAQSVLLKDVNVVTTSGRATCVEFNMNVFASEATAASRAASSLQSSLCANYRSDPCLTGRSDYQQVCINELTAAPQTTAPSSSTITSSLSLLTLALTVLCTIVLSQLGTV